MVYIAREQYVTRVCGHHGGMAGGALEVSIDVYFSSVAGCKMAGPLPSDAEGFLSG